MSLGSKSSDPATGQQCLTLGMTDLSAQRAALARAREFERLGRAILDSAPYSIIIVTLEGAITGANRATEVLLGYTRDELIGHSPRLFHAPAEVAARAAKLSADIGRTVIPGPELFFLQREFYGFEESEWTYVRKDGREVPIALSVSRLFDDEGRHVGSVRVSIDITERKRAADRMRHLAEHDALTGLSNRVSLQVLLEEATAIASTHPFARVFVDLDGFKGINDTRGHAAGDALLKAVADRLRAGVRASDVIARLGGDEFVLLLREIATDDEAMRVIGKLIGALRQPFDIDGEVCIGASAGAALCPRDAVDAASLLRRADAAMYSAKNAARLTSGGAGGTPAPA